MDNFPLHLIPLLPLVGAALNLAIGRRAGKEFATAVALASVAGACVLGWMGFFALLRGGEHGALTGTFFDGDWLSASEAVEGASLHIKAGLLMDHLSAVMVLVITTIGFLIHLYSTSYMEDDEGYSRYFGYLNLFTGSMLILVLGDSLPVTFVGWEGVGLCSYLLIGFWYQKDANASAGRKAFVVNRVGDFCFLLGMFMIFSVASTLRYDELAGPNAIAALRQLFVGHASYATIAGLLLFIGATGKSAQFPLYIWLPDAMAGPTPVSALIHAATMVTAGVYMIARLHGIFAIDPAVLAVIACVGAFTALFAATMGIVQKPIKKILAYSTISQLGFMFIGVGTATYTAGMFHLVTHAVFKAGLFLAAGSIMHAQHGEEDVMKMGGLRRKLPITHAVYLIYCLAIAGLPPFAGFFSKDAILAGAWSFGSLEVGEAGAAVVPESIPGWPHWLGAAIWATGLVAAACTAFYMFRSYFLVFWGSFRGDRHTFDHAHESPPAMAWPLILLAVGSVVVGFLGVPEVFHARNYFDEWLTPSVFARAEAVEGAGHAATEFALMGVAIVVSLGGIALAFALYGRGVAPLADRLEAGLPRLYKLVYNKYYVDEIYALLIGRPLRWLATWPLAVLVDRYLIDGLLVNGPARVIDIFGRAMRLFQNGDVQRGVVGVAVGAAAFVLCGANWTAWRAAVITRVVVSGAEVQVTARGAPSTVTRPLEYHFDFGDKSQPVVSSQPQATHRYQAGGKHEVVVTVVDPRWHSRASASASISAARSGGEK